MSRRWRFALALIAVAAASPAAQAQDNSGPPQTIDLLVPQNTGDDDFEDCSAEQEAASISGEIVVCRRRRDQSEFGYDAERAQQRYATETMNKGDPRAPDFAESCAKNPEKGACISFGKVPPPAYMVDFDALPDTPPGSDADRVGRGLAPQGREGPQQSASAVRQSELGLPPVPAVEKGAAAAVTPGGSASPEAEPSG